MDLLVDKEANVFLLVLLRVNVPHLEKGVKRMLIQLARTKCFSVEEEALVMKTTQGKVVLV